MIVPVDVMSDWVVQLMLPFFRVLGFVMTMPVIGTRLVTGRVKLALSFAITLVIIPNVDITQTVDPLSVWSWVLVGRELFVGIGLGFCLQLLFHIAVVSGQLVAMQTGLGFSSLLDPNTGISVASISQFFMMTFSLLFLSINGHLVVFQMLADSFQLVPAASGGLSVDAFHMLAKLGSWLFVSAVAMALPAILSLLVINISFGVMSRAAPQLNIFTIGFPITMMVGLFIVWVTTSNMAHFFSSAFEESMGFVFQLMGM